MPNSASKQIQEIDSGFTLVEVLIAMAIFAIGIMAVFSLQFSAAKNSNGGNHITQATLLAQTKLEELKSVQDVTTLANGSENGIDAEGNSGGRYERLWTVTNPLGGSRTRHIAVTITWRFMSRDRTLTLQTITQGVGL
jgi:type II secretion system protein I